jgi:4'-phosphopantetheinyl transferase EntD
MQSLVPPEVVVTVADQPWMWQEGLLPEEAACLTGTVVEARRREFTAGRNCARRALTELGHPAVPIPVGAHREPLWPAGIVGSITHCEGYCAAAVARSDAVAAVGIDAELNQPLKPGIEGLICMEAEKRWLKTLPSIESIHWSTLLFSAKESLIKAWFSLSGQRLDAQQTTIDIAPQDGFFTARLDVSVPHKYDYLSAQIKGRFKEAGRYLLTTIVIPLSPQADQAPVPPLTARPTRAAAADQDVESQGAVH